MALLARTTSGLCALACAALVAPLTAPASAWAQAGTSTQAAVPSRAINVPKDKSAAFRLDRPVGEMVVAQPDIAQIVATTDRSFYVRGKTLGATNILVYDTDRRLIEVIDVRVGADADALRADLAASLPGEAITVRNMGDGFLLTGNVSTPAAASRALGVAERHAPKAVSSSLTVTDSQQVMLEVRIIEASRSALQDFGIDVSVTGGNVTIATGNGGLLGNTPAHGVLSISGTAGNNSIDVTLRALEEQGVIRTLAKPNLVAVSGETAEFLAGGEFPYPVPSRDNVTIEFRPFGVKLKFLPIVQDNGLIRLKVEPEVSQLDPRQSLRFAGFDVPSLTVRRASTTIDLRDAQSFAIAGLFQQEYLNLMRETPGLADVPILGALFRSARWRKQETELVIIVTPYLKGADRPMHDPLAKGAEASAIDLILEGLALDRPMNRPVGVEPTDTDTDA